VATVHVHRWLRWPLRLYAGLLGFVVLALLGTIAVVPLAQGTSDWPTSAGQQVAALRAWVSGHPVLALSIGVVLVGLFLLSLAAKQEVDWEQNVAAEAQVRQTATAAAASNVQEQVPAMAGQVASTIDRAVATAQARTARRGPMMLRVFVSSTSVDLTTHRAAVRQAIERLDQHPVVMEDFGARDGDATRISTEAVAEADVFVLLVAWRYGYVPAGETSSVTHLEYEQAKVVGLPRLVFLADPSTEAAGHNALFPSGVRDAAHQEQLRAFRAELERDRVVAYFTTPEDRALKVSPALARVLLAIAITEERLAQQAAAAQRAADAAPGVPSGVVSPSGLPRPASLVGREDELATLMERLRAGGAQAVGVFAVEGLLGVGKTALAAEAVARLSHDRETFPGGAAWISCEGLAGTEGLAELWSRVARAGGGAGGGAARSGRAPAGAGRGSR
jgi:hypothetical protein